MPSKFFSYLRCLICYFQNILLQRAIFLDVLIDNFPVLVVLCVHCVMALQLILRFLQGFEFVLELPQFCPQLEIFLAALFGDVPACGVRSLMFALEPLSLPVQFIALLCLQLVCFFQLATIQLIVADCLCPPFSTST